jgi:hypothetical protein
MIVWQKYTICRFFGLTGSSSWVSELSGDLVSWNFSRVTYNFPVTNVFILLHVAIWKWNFLTLDMNLIRIYFCFQIGHNCILFLTRVNRYLPGNNLNGTIPAELGNLTVSKYLYTILMVSHNYFLIKLTWCNYMFELLDVWILSSSYNLSKTMTCAT